MIEVFVVYTGHNNQRTMIPGSPFANRQQANTELYNYGVLQAGTWPHFIALIDEYGFVFPGGNVISVPTKP
jgi:hypothetical protein